MIGYFQDLPTTVNFESMKSSKFKSHTETKIDNLFIQPQKQHAHSNQSGFKTSGF